MTPFETAVRTIQFLSADAVEKANSGHPGTPMALAGIATEIFARQLRYNPKDPAWPNRDRFVLSCGHASMLIYSVLHLAGYDVSKDDLVNFRQFGSKTPGHPEYGHTPGVETTTGPLGQGFGNAVGMAAASKMLGARLGEALFNYRVFVLASDGDLMEGVCCEAASLAGHLRLANLIVVYDANNITIDGTADLSFSEDVGKRFEAYGWRVAKVDGHDPEEVHTALSQATQQAAAADGRPMLIVARTHIGIGCPTKQDSSAAHGAALGREEINGAKKAAGWPLDEFVIPNGAGQVFAERVAAVLPEYQAWKSRAETLDAAKAEQLRAFTGQAVPKNVFAQLLAAADDKNDATRNSGGRLAQRAAELVPALVSGSADLAGSTKTDIKGAAFVNAGEYAGRNFHFGVREHGMAAMANGLALSGFVPVISTFLIFSDYLRPSVRLASMMQQRVVLVFTHDSFFVGEDGPTHQPIEQLSSLRLIPGVHVFRPADSLECAAAWGHALERSDGPTAIALTRQTLPALTRPSGFSQQELRQGAYVIAPCDDPTLVVIATGSEVHVALGAKPLLEAKGQRVRVVSAPCLELFLAQPKTVRDAVLGTARRVSVEAGATPWWRSIVGLDGITIGLDRFGASAPAELLQQEFGFTTEAVAERILREV